MCVCACVCVCLRIFDSLLSLYSFAISLLMHCFFKHVYWEKTKQEKLIYTFIFVVVINKNMQKITPLSPPHSKTSLLLAKGVSDLRPPNRLVFRTSFLRQATSFNTVLVIPMCGVYTVTFPSHNILVDVARIRESPEVDLDSGELCKRSKFEDDNLTLSSMCGETKCRKLVEVFIVIRLVIV